MSTLTGKPQVVSKEQQESTVYLEEARSEFSNRYVVREAQKIVAKEVLDKLRALDSKALVAGGAPRDWYWGKPAKDIDIFYYLPQQSDHSTSLEYHIKALKELFGSDVKLKLLGLDTAGANFFHNIQTISVVEDFNNYQLNPNIQHVFEFEYNSETIQLIALTKQGVDVEEFAYNVCQAWWDGATIGYTEMFKVGMDKKLLIETGQLYANSAAYKRKMKEKFSDFTYIAPRIIKESP
jgi:hypothetical protein